MRLSTLLATATSVAVLSALPSAPAFAGTAERQAACTALGGTFNAGGSPRSPDPTKDKCTVTQTVVGPATPSGTPTVTNSPVQDVGEPTTVVSDPVRQPDPTISTEERNAGDSTSVTTYRRGTPVVTEKEQDAGEPISESVVVPGVPTIETRTERGTSTTTETPTTTNCYQLNADDTSKKPVIRCERAVLYTTTTQTTVITTTTTPRENVTTTTQPRETVITTTTPVTEVVTTTQPRESCTTTTYQTVITTTTTQRRGHTQTTTQPTTRTTTTTTTTYTYAPGSDVPVPGVPKVTTTTAAGPNIVTTVPIEDEPVVSTSTKAGPEESDVVCTATAPEVTSRDGATTNDVITQTVPAPSVVTVTREDIAPLVVVTEAPGAPIVTTEVRSTGEACYINPSTAEQRRNRC